MPSALRGRGALSGAVLFMWGARKPVMFHSSKWLRVVEECGGRTQCIDGAGHWFMETHPGMVNESLQSWFRVPDESGGG